MKTNLTESLKRAVKKQIEDPFFEEIFDQHFRAQDNRLILSILQRNELRKMPKGNSLAKA
jgi:hypothetical protein